MAWDTTKSRGDHLAAAVSQPPPFRSRCVQRYTTHSALHMLLFLVFVANALFMRLELMCVAVGHCARPAAHMPSNGQLRGALPGGTDGAARGGCLVAWFACCCRALVLTQAVPDMGGRVAHAHRRELRVRGG